MRHSRGGYGPFATSFDPAMTLSWSEPARLDGAVRRDAAQFARAIDAVDLAAVGARLHRFAGPVRLVWGTADPFFPLELAQRLAAAFSDAEVVEVEGARTFVPLDAPARVAAEIVALTEAASRRAAR